MIDIAAAAGCSRATLYRYFPNRDSVRAAFVHRGTLQMAAAIARREGASDSPAERVLAGIAAVRSNPSLAVWFEPENVAVPLQVSRSSELLHALAAALLDDPADPSIDAESLAQRGAWLLRSIISLLAMPAPDAETEQALVRDTLIPALRGTLPPLASTD